jgi:ADP-ribosylglycohydrolase
MDAQREETNVLRVPMPFSLNQRSDTFELSPTDDTEWVAWTMKHLLAHACAISESRTLEAWRALAEVQASVRGWVSTQCALSNLRTGLLPPASGHDHPHYFDDGAMVRAVPIGIAYAGDPKSAARAAAIDSSVTNSEDGIWCAQAIAAAMSVACAGSPLEGVHQAALETLPADSWSRRTVDDAMRLYRDGAPMLAQIPALHTVLNAEYSDGCVAPEILALTLAIVRSAKGSFDSALLGALSMEKAADTLPALVGTLAGALSEQPVVPEEWNNRLRTLRGVSLPDMEGVDFVALVDEFIERSARNPEETKS